MNFNREEYEKFLHLLLKYCEENQYHLLSFYENLSFGKYFLMSKSDDLNMIRAKYENRMVFTKEMINDDFFSSYSPNQRIPIFKIDCETGLNKNKIYSELMVDCLWTYDKALFQKIHQYFQSWSEFNQFQYDAAIVYKNRDYPKGFADQNVALYSYNKNLHHIIELTEDDFKSYFNDVWNIETFRSIYPQSCTINPLPILRSLHFQDLGYDEQFTLSKFIMEVYGVGGCFENDNILRSFGRKIEALNSLLREIDADNLIVEDKDVVLKSLKIKKDDFVSYFSNNDMLPRNKIEMAELIINTIASNEIMKDLGLIKIYDGREFNFFIEFKPDAKLDVKQLSEVILSCFDVFFRRNGTNDLKQMVDLNIRKIFLEKNLEQDVSDSHIVKKVKI